MSTCPATQGVERIKRRHLDMGQKVALALEIEPHFAEEARKRQWSGKQANLTSQKETASEADLVGKSPTRLSTPAVTPVDMVERRSVHRAAKSVGLSEKTLQTAKAIRKAAPDKFEKIKSGELTVAKAKREVKQEQDRRDLVEAGTLDFGET